MQSGVELGIVFRRSYFLSSQLLRIGSNSWAGLKWAGIEFWVRAEIG